MAMAFPLADADFFGGLRVASSTFFLGNTTIHSGTTGGGEVLTAARGSRLWSGSASLTPGYHLDAREIEALISVMEEAGASFFATPLPRLGPRYDPRGLILGSAQPRILALAANNKEMSLTGLPPGYRLGRGDYLSFSYRSNPTRHALHRIVSPEAVADSTGKTPLFEVRPHIRPGALTGAAVQVVRPVMKAQIVPESVSRPTAAPLVSEAISFSFIQTLR